MAKLYELSEVYLRLLEMDGEEGDFSKSLEEVKEQFEQKAVNLAKLFLSLEANADVYDNEIRRLNEHKTSLKNKVVWLRNYLQREMEATQIDTIKGDVVSVSLQKSPPSCVVVDDSAIPSNFKVSTLKMPTHVVPEELLHYKSSLDDVAKQEIIQLWKEGIDVPGTKVVQNKHVRIR